MNTATTSLLQTASRRLRAAGVLALAALLTACATPKGYDYTAFKQSRPVTLLVLPPVNDTPDIKATYGVLSQVTMPLAEAGYYVLPVSLVDETFRQNGFNHPAEIKDIPPRKLREIFGADAALYMRVRQYGTSFAVISSETRVTIEASLVDLRTQQLLWQGEAQASSQENQNNANQGGGLVGLLVNAVVTQIIETTSDASFKYAALASQRLLVPRHNGMLHGPRSPQYLKD